MGYDFDWIQFYEEFADKLLDYKDKKQELFEKINGLVSKNERLEYLHFERDDWWSPRNYEIDPFSVFAMFNRQISDENRIAIIKLLAKEFDIKSDIPTDFKGIPVMNPMSSVFGGNDEVWKLFLVTMECAKNNEFTEEFFVVFENAIKAKNNGLGTVTMGLFWIRPKMFLNLDNTNKEYLADNENFKSVIQTLPKSIEKYTPNGKEYIFMCEEIKKIIDNGDFKFKNFAEMSYNAWESKPKSENGKVENKVSKAHFLKWFAPLIQALKDLGGCATPKEAVAKIIENENLSEEVQNETRGKNGFNKLHNDINWSRNYLVYAGIIDKSKRGIWSLTEKGYKVIMTDEVASEIFYKKWWLEKESQLEKKYWIFSAGQGASKWEKFYNEDIMAIGWDDLGDLKEYSSKDDIKEKMQNDYDSEKSYRNDCLAVWQFANDMQIGDVVYSKKGQNRIVGRGIVKSDYLYDDSREEFKHIRKIEWTHKGDFDAPNKSVLKTLTDLTQYTEYVEKLENLFFEKIIECKSYTKQDFLNEVYIDCDEYDTIKGLLLRKKNLILKGAPGVGKTFAAQRLAYSILEKEENSKIEIVQFHQSYSYEDFIMGFRPTEQHFKLEQGVFYKFCKKAKANPSEKFFFIIDEINRGNLSKIFGELFMLIEKDKRGKEITLLYSNSDEKFCVPENVYIIGMMNTADRSLAMLDYALRRRFSFYEMQPAFENAGFIKYKNEIDNEKFNKVIDEIIKLNDVINDDESLGSGFRIGHSYFISKDKIDNEWIKSVVEYELIPLLNEYWFDEKEKIEKYSSKLREAIK